MTAMKLSSLTLLAAAAAMAAAQAVAQSAPHTASTAIPSRTIVVSLQDRKLALVENGRAIAVYTVAVGKPSTPSPVGAFTIEHRVVNPTYYHDGRVIAPGPHNPVGTRWMGLSIRGYGIHGTNAPGSIGKAVSHGCIRMSRPDLERLFAQVSIGDKVELIARRDAETAELFGDGPEPARAVQPQPLLTAKSAAPAPIEASAPAKNDAAQPARLMNVSAKTGPAMDKGEPVTGSL
ncbi:MAG: L,D-transpeptidase [Terracidiphilus sp.]